MLQDDGQTTVTLTAYTSVLNTYSCVLNQGEFPVSSYTSTIQVLLTAAGSNVIWKGNFKRKDLSENPVKRQGDEAATTTIHALYLGGLDNLKNIRVIFFNIGWSFSAATFM